MSITPDRSQLPVLSYAGTVELAQLHRRNPREAFLTDAVRTGAHCFAAAARLPAEHPHYSAHTGPSSDRTTFHKINATRPARIASQTVNKTAVPLCLIRGTFGDQPAHPGESALALPSSVDV